MITRRQAIKTTVAAVGYAAAGGAFVTSSHAEAGPNAVVAGPFSLPPLPYAYDALEPYIDAQTMQIHHDRHHAAYVANLNKAVAGQSNLAGKSVEELLRNLGSLPASIQTAVRNQGGGHANHSFFWQEMAKTERQHPRGQLNLALEKRWGTFDNFKQTFTTAALSIFGSGWAWLTVAGTNKVLRIETTPNQDTPLLVGRTPLFGLDVWEHAYYLKYQNRRAEYIAAFYNVINWDWVGSKYDQFQA